MERTLQARLPGFCVDALLGAESLQKYSREISDCPFCLSVCHVCLSSSPSVSPLG